MTSLLAVWLLAAVAQGQTPGRTDPTPWQPTLAPRTGVGASALQPVGRLVAQNKEEEEGGLTYPRTPKGIRTVGQVAGRKTATEEDIDFAIRTELPDPGELFQRQSESQLFERIRQEARKRPGSGRVIFPSEPVIGRGPYAGRNFHPMSEIVEPQFVCHKRLFFEQKNFERYGWSLGAIQPPVHLLIFWYDVLMLPYHFWERPCQDWDCNSGKLLPGDPTPFYFYRERFSLSGLAAETATFWAGGFIFR
jgi:hypothetical protein